MLVGLLPVTKFPNTHFDGRTQASKMPGLLKQLLFHCCMRCILRPLRVENQLLWCGIDVDGAQHDFFIILLAWLANLEEQWLIAALSQTCCPCCVATKHEFGTHTSFERRSGESIIAALAELQQTWRDANFYQFAGKAIEAGYTGIEPADVCWEGLGVDICQVISVDMLHGLHKFIHNHVLLWIQRTIGEAALDQCLQAQIYHSGRCIFKLGVLKLTQMARRENQELEHHLLVAIASAEDNEGESLDPCFFVAIQALMDFVWCALIKCEQGDVLNSICICVLVLMPFPPVTYPEAS